MRRMRMSRPAASRASLRQFLSCRASKIALEHALVGPCEPWLWGPTRVQKRPGASSVGTNEIGRERRLRGRPCSAVRVAVRVRRRGRPRAGRARSDAHGVSAKDFATVGTVYQIGLTASLDRLAHVALGGELRRGHRLDDPRSCRQSTSAVHRTRCNDPKPVCFRKDQRPRRRRGTRVSPRAPGRVGSRRGHWPGAFRVERIRYE